MGRLSRLREDLRLRAVLVGVAVGYAMLVTGALGVIRFGTRLRPADVNVVAFAVSVQLLELLPWLLGGAVAGYLEADSRLRSGVNGWASGLVAGFVLGFVGWFLIVAGFRVEPAPTYGLADTLRLLVVAPLVAGVGLGLLLSVVGTIGGVLGFAVRQRTR